MEMLREPFSSLAVPDGEQFRGGKQTVCALTTEMALDRNQVVLVEHLHLCE